VAGFLGSPAMNFVEADIVAGGEAVLPTGERLTLPEAPAAKPGRKAILGIRPHDFVPSAEGAAVEVTFAEALGGETYAYGKLGADRVVVRLDASERVRPGEVLRVRVDPARIQLFEAEGGRSLRW
jgi:ABC-type sugar transport system ATPase subunit